MKKAFYLSLFVNALLIVMVLLEIYGPGKRDNTSNQTLITSETMNPEIIHQQPLTYRLPEPGLSGSMSVEEAIFKRRSHRNYVRTSISAQELSQVLWAAYGITKPDTSRAIFRGGFRTPPSAGATYPLEIYAIAGDVDGLEPGVYRYHADGHKLVLESDVDIRAELAAAALNQEMIADAPASLFFSAIFERTMQRYGERGRLRYVPMDLGHAAQNVYLQVESLGLGTCAIGAFNDELVSKVMNLPSGEEPLYIMPIGKYYRD